jgi:hypothetical protein
MRIGYHPNCAWESLYRRPFVLLGKPLVNELSFFHVFFLASLSFPPSGGRLGTFSPIFRAACVIMRRRPGYVNMCIFYQNQEGMQDEFSATTGKEDLKFEIFDLRWAADIVASEAWADC